MQRRINNLISSKAPMMIAMRYTLVGVIALLGLTRLRLILILMGFPDYYKGRDVLELYLMAKSLISGLNPYTPLNELVQIFIGPGHFYTHPSPYPPFVAIMSIPLLWFGINKFYIAWFIFELGCLLSISCMLIYLWKQRINFLWVGILFLVLLALYTVQYDLLFGQMSILLTAILLGVLLCLRNNRNVLAGVLVGVSVAIKLITWPLMIYFALKKDWRALIASSLTALLLNMIALMVIGIKPFMDYYLKVSTIVLNGWRTVIYNFSLWSIGSRLFEGTGSTMTANSFIAPPLIYFPQVATLVSSVIAVFFLIIGLVGALRAKDLNIAFAIMVCVILGIAPLSWDHYYVLIVIVLAIGFQNLQMNSYPVWQTFLYTLVTGMILLFDDKISSIVTIINGGEKLLKANGYHITFISSLFYWLPILELVTLTILLLRSVIHQKQISM